MSLTTVKVRNWDESITTIPPYKLISESFQNYANMRDGGGRQVRRSIYIDLNSVRFLTGEELQCLVDDGFIGADSKIKAGTPQSVNIRIFRHYLERRLPPRLTYINSRGVVCLSRGEGVFCLAQMFLISRSFLYLAQSAR